MIHQQSEMTAICIKNAGKCYRIYDRPVDRLKQSLWRGKKNFFREFWAVRNISFEIRKGETVGIIGSNGSGKSTLLQLICGILNPTVGELGIDGRIAALLELGAGFNPEFTGRENVFMNAAIMGLSGPEIEERYNGIVKFANIGQFIDHPVKTYSSGMYVRLAFATAINVSPDILVVDEALAVGDIRFQQKCIARIKNFCQTGTVIFVSHDMTSVTELCSRVIWIESGSIRMDGSPKSVIEKYFEYMYEADADLKTGGSDTTQFQQHDISGFLPVTEDIRQFGDRRMTISGVRLFSPAGNNTLVYGDQWCEISMLISVHEDIANTLAGYLVLDRLGREIFGDRSSLSGLSAGKQYIITFRIEAWPNIAEGEYTLTLGAGDGNLEHLAMSHYLHDVLVIKSMPVKAAAAGIIAVPNTDVILSEI
ncbi:MAG: ABC transporter ATP-binding protein [Desulfobacteraceae bacterium]|nr:ABC transporter ATP-binding protein [Desulfobacteraceae bacterium]